MHTVTTQGVDEHLVLMLHDNGASRVTAETFHDPSTASIRSRVTVPDMAPAFRKITVTVDAEALHRGGKWALFEPWRELRSWVEREREVRRWSHVDP